MFNDIGRNVAFFINQLLNCFIRPMHFFHIERKQISKVRDLSKQTININNNV